jgi:Zn-dependent protease
MFIRHLDLTQMVLTAPVILLALSFHEFAHAWTADRLGDPTARAEGRLSLNPLHHLDLVGTIALFLFGFGWARPVPINIYFLRRQIRDFAITALAGPAANLIAALAFGLLFRLLATGAGGGFLLTVTFLGVWINLGLAAFNLIPIPPLDGSRVVYYLLPRNLAAEYIKLEPLGMFIVIALLLLDSGTGIISSWIRLVVSGLGGLFAGSGFRA